MTDEQNKVPLYLNVTSEMVNAGILELRERTFGDPLDDVVRDIFVAMIKASGDSAQKNIPCDNTHWNENILEKFKVV